MSTPPVDPPSPNSHRGTTIIIVALITLIIVAAGSVFMTMVNS